MPAHALVSAFSKRDLAQARSQFYHSIRAFFDDRDYVEVETPLLSSHLIPESAIEVFATERVFSNGIKEQVFLTPSPEIYMKDLLSQGLGSCYQLTKSFRNMEESSKRHANEFTMLEWYGLAIDYKENIAQTQALLRHLAHHATNETRHLFTDFIEVTMSDLFKDIVQIDLEQAQTLEQLQQQATAVGFADYVAKAKDWETLFNFIFVSSVEPRLPLDKTVFVVDYPAQITTTARRNNQHYERWEFYSKGWEIANCYTEQADYHEMHALFTAEGALKQQMQVPHSVNFQYLEIFKDNKFPQCSGVALGVDRLLAVALNAESIQQISLF